MGPTRYPLRVLTFLLVLGLPLPAHAGGGETALLPQDLVEACEVDERAETGLVHLRCGPTRVLVAQVRPLDSDVHDEILASVQDLVPMPSLRAEVPQPDPDLRRSTLVQARDGLERGQVSVHLQLTTRRSTGRSVACMVGLLDRRRADQAELAWCEQATRSVLPAPERAVATQVQVQIPDLPPEEL